jgi:hypothetical protein
MIRYDAIAEAAIPTTPITMARRWTIGVDVMAGSGMAAPYVALTVRLQVGRPIVSLTVSERRAE